MKLVQLQYFLKVAECHSISKASCELFISQPALSESIKSFESEMGSQIFERTRKGVKLTPKGKEVYHIVQRIQRDVEELQRFAINNEDIKAVNLAVVPMVSGTTFLQIINEIYQQFPKLEISPEELRPRELLQHLRDGKVDIALCSKRRDDEALFNTIIAEMHLQHKKLVDVPLRVYAAKDSQLAKKAAIGEKDVEGLTCFVLNDYKNWAGHERQYVLSSRDIIFNAVAHNRGYTVMPETASIGNNYFSSGQICTVPLKEETTVPLEIIYPAKNNVTSLDEKICSIIEKAVLDNY
ncbi:MULTISPECIES: LysR family transcriptional regulator [unclassified Lactobacillus]|uniref:LysR family transcriptional regulator n=1 Tax=unclassified Lactobacillus TaxID=2620435 RepID=UPI0023F699D0|nr:MULTISPECIES: LysR family transcriptional regulator [unclassified Lactobacillus]MDF7668769.1 LysR family transcriptional regulator [Lactobacillus sp. ESL0703]WEV38541.1 LysR family transcriptional regulator [Lactobacillus sp. ESL0680]